MTKSDKQTQPEKPYVEPSLTKDQQLKKITEGEVVVVSVAAEPPQ